MKHNGLKYSEEGTRFTDSDWAGFQETRKSPSAGVIMFGRHTLKACTRNQNNHCKKQCRSSAEAELYATVLGASGSKGIVSVLTDLGCEMEASVGH